MTPRNANEFRDMVRRSGGMVSDGPLPAEFTEAWGKAPMQGGPVAHYFKADRSFDLGGGAFGVVSACRGLTTVYTSRVPIFGPGNYPFCARCEAVLMRRMRTSK